MKRSRIIMGRDVIKIQHLGVINKAVSFSQLILSYLPEMKNTKQRSMK